MLKILCAGHHGLSPATSAQFTLEMYVAARNHIKSTYFKSSGSFEVIDVDTPKKLVASDCYDMQHVCTYLQPFSRWISQ